MNDARDVGRIKLVRAIKKVVRDESLDLDDTISDLIDAVLGTPDEE